MTWRSLAMAMLAGSCVASALCPAVEVADENTAAANSALGNDISVHSTSEPSVQYLPFDAPAGMSRAVVVQGLPLVYTRQLLPLDGKGELVGEGSADEQIEQVLTNLQAVLVAAGSDLDNLIRLNVYALSRPVADRLREQLSKRTRAAVRPAITSVLTPLAHRQALVAVDAVAVAADRGRDATLLRCEAVAGEAGCADAAVLPRGGVAYLSGQPARGGLAKSAVAQSLSALLQTLEQLKLSPAHVVQLKVFLTPAASAEAAFGEIKRFFPDRLTPPVVFVEWIASAPVEIELIAQLPLAGQPAEPVEYFNPPDVKPSPAFSRVALVRTDRQIHIGGLAARAAGDGQAQAQDAFAQLKSILAETGSDLRHLAKATYYVTEDDASRGIDLARRELYDPLRPPAASKVTVHAVGQPDRTLAIAMIAVGRTR